LRLLRCSQLGVALLQHFVQVSNLFGPVLKIGGEQPLGLLRLGRRDLGALLVELGGYFGLDALPVRRDFLLLLPLGDAQH
jgi:hypothetical protein